MSTSAPFLEYAEDSHTYYLDGEEIISVTQVLKEVGAVDTEYFTEEHSRRGTLVHLMAELMDRKADSRPELFDHIDDYGTEEITVGAQYAAQWAKLREAVPFEIVGDGIERKAFCPVYKYACRLDRHVHFPGCPRGLDALIEIKTNKSGYIPKWTRLQLAGQGHALAPGEALERYAAILTPDSWKLEPFPIETYVDDRDDFLSMVRTARWLRANTSTQ